MLIIFSPMRQDAELALERQGDTLHVNDTAFDFSGLAEGESHVPSGPGSDWFVAPVTRVEGVLHISLILPHGADAPRETLFPAPLEAPLDGPLPVPLWSLPQGEGD
ncbi:hypothetical protein [Ruegeria marina]|uniref:Uncharacterized protein n=1 Tax=Ruegeria marina TaxID=639004 RepID=A0A1G7E6G5_9RHOB|nr:hypothetical protein [Ruegeria marina]SDE59090.1 hypothetical protein SAMN04488239_1243 [Ruegeria marina]